MRIHILIPYLQSIFIIFYRVVPSLSSDEIVSLRPPQKVDRILAFKYSNLFSFEHPVHDKKKKEEYQALASAFFDDLSKSLGPFSLSPSHSLFPPFLSDFNLHSVTSVGCRLHSDQRQIWRDKCGSPLVEKERKKGDGKRGRR